MSSCLLGETVRYDAGHKRNGFLADDLARFVDFVPRCPEMAIGLGAPREPIHLVQGTGGRIGAAGARSRTAVDARLRGYGDLQARELVGLCGYVFKRGSPSCGLYRVPLHDAAGRRTGRRARGLYAAHLTAALPWLPVEEEDRLADPGLRDSFLARVFTLARLRRTFAPEPSAQALVAVHSDHKYLLLAHNAAACRRLGRLVADAGSGPIGALAEAYRDGIMAALARPARVAGHVNALQHLAGYLRPHLDRRERAELAEAIDAFRGGRLPWLAVAGLLRQQLQRHPHPWAARQAYLAPYPDELAAARPAPSE